VEYVGDVFEYMTYCEFLDVSLRLFKRWGRCTASLFQFRTWGIYTFILPVRRKIVNVSLRGDRQGQAFGKTRSDT